MNTIRFGILVALTAGIACAGLSACGDTSGSGGGGGQAAGGEPATGGSGAAGGGTGGTAPTSGFCLLACTEVADCCAGNPNCPGDAYPNNPTCDGGFCTGAQCGPDDDCTFGGALPGYECAPIDTGTGSDFNTCVPICTTDDDCMDPLTCVGDTTDGQKYCSSPVDPCTGDAECQGYGTCDTGSGFCVCGDDTECTAEGTACFQ